MQHFCEDYYGLPTWLSGGEGEGLTCTVRYVHDALHTRHSEGLLCRPNYVTAPGTFHLVLLYEFNVIKRLNNFLKLS